MPLTRGESDHVLGGRVPPAARGELYRLSGGNPFYLEELARGAQADGPTSSSAGSATLVAAIPTAVQGVLTSELEALSPRAHALDSGSSRRRRSLRDRVGRVCRRDARGRRARRHSTNCSPPTSFAPARYRDASSSAIRSCATPSTPRPVRMATRRPRPRCRAAGGPWRECHVARPSRRALGAPR